MPNHGRTTFNGINGATGTYGLSPMNGEELLRLLQGEAGLEHLSELRSRFLQESDRHFGVKEAVDLKRLEEAGWGVIFTQDADPAIREALAPLLDMRRAQAGALFRIYERAEGYRPGESKTEFLARRGTRTGPVDPAKTPYYLLLVGSPEAIPFRFQSELALQYAVGRLHFDRVEDYAAYAANVVVAEQGKIEVPRRVGFFGPSHLGDLPTRRSLDHLVAPLSEDLREARPDWQISTVLGAQATKAALTRLLGGGETPALLLTASHGLEFSPGDSRRLPHQGALLCSDWPGPEEFGPIPQDFYFAGDDLAPDARRLGLVTFHFSCYSAGSPRFSPGAFLAALPKALLASGGGAVVGHVNRAWGYSFEWPGAGAQTTVFRAAFSRLFDGHPLGSALKYFNERHVELSTMLAYQLDEMRLGAEPNSEELAGLWTANNDARDYLVLGDPAVRLAVATPGEKARERPVIKGSELQMSEGGASYYDDGGRTEEEARRESEAAAALESLAEATAREALERAERQRLERGDIPDATLPGQGAFSVGLPVTARPPSDSEVRFSAWHPRALAVGETAKLLVYAHLLAARDAVAADAGQDLGKAAGGYREAKATASSAIAEGTEITVVPQAEGLTFGPSQARITWSGAWQRANFTMTATTERAGHVIQASIACYVGPLLIADIPLSVVVPRPEDGYAAEVGGETGQAFRSARIYQAVFASYSHADTGIVEGMERAIKALGMEYLRDVMKLRSGQDWSAELLHMIEKADIFQLFWSTTACQSTFVEQEWRYALSLTGRKGPAFIRPIYWQKPKPPVPAPLSHIHFAPFDPFGFSAARPARPLAFLPTDGEDLTTLTISTYAAADPAAPETARLAARTCIGLIGDIDSHLSANPADAYHLDIHAKIVGEALRARLALLELLAEKHKG